jgi:ATP-dependent RNA helicase RhlE
MSFSALRLHPALVQNLTALGYEAPSPIQSRAIPAILAGQDLLAGAQTGTGKTAAFALPILHRLLSLPERGAEARRAIRALVLVPTRELAVQVAKSIMAYAKGEELRCALVYGGVSIEAQVQALAEGVDILVATPGRLLDHLRQRALTLQSLQVLVFDEADRMLDMGFMDEITAVLAQVPKERQTLLFSATLGDAIFSLSRSLLRDPVTVEVAPRNTTAQQIEQKVYAVDAERKAELVCHLINNQGWHPVLIFSRTRQGCDKLARQLQEKGITAAALHGDLAQGAREQVLQSFRLGEMQALIATDVAARGLDISFLQYVINFELPFVAEDYVHRIGRTGRAGASGIAVTLFSPEDALRLEEVEVVLDKRLPQQWYPGFEPDLDKMATGPGRGGRAAHKQRAKKRALGQCLWFWCCGVSDWFRGS